jgi:hypothetical protein
LQFVRLVPEHRLSAGKLVALRLEKLGLLFELRIALLQFGLLQFQSRLRVLEGLALLFEFLVGGAQLLAMRAQLLGLSQHCSVEFQATLYPECVHAPECGCNFPAMARQAEQMLV